MRSPRYARRRRHGAVLNAGHAARVLRRQLPLRASARIIPEKRRLYGASKESEAPPQRLIDHAPAALALLADLRKAIAREELCLHYQVQVDAAGKPVGAEVLLRWQHPERGMVSPAEFIPLAEESGLIVPIGVWVLENACAQIAAWKQHPLLGKIAVAVNVSAFSFHQPGFADFVRSVVRRHKVNPLLLKLELTESLALQNAEMTIATMNALREFGIGFSLDDFGTGFSSLSHLKLLPLDQIKIDQSFVRNVIHDNADKVMIMAITSLGINFELDVVAEGVEAEAQFKLLRRIGCERFQGYLFGKPMPAPAFEAWASQGGSPSTAAP